METFAKPACPTCHEGIPPRQKSTLSWRSTALSGLILLLPKCPFCIVAYTSSMAVCGAPSLIHHQTDWGAWLAIGLALICLVSIARNYRGPGTRTALWMAGLGLALLLAGLFLPNAMLAYYFGGVILFLSSFYNGRGYRFFTSIQITSRLNPVTRQ